MNQRVRIIRGDPTPEEVAAVVTAISRAQDEDAERRLVPVVPAWLRAARQESIGGDVAAAPADLSPDV